MRAGIAVPITRQLPRRAVTGVWTLRTPLLWLAGCSVLVVHGPGVQLFCRAWMPCRRRPLPLC